MRLNRFFLSLLCLVFLFSTNFARAANQNIIPLNSVKELSALMKANKDKVIFLNFWATWCPPCREELPYINEIRKIYSEKDVIMILVSIDSEVSAVSAFIKKSPLSLTVYHDSTGEIASKLQIASIPTTVILGRKNNNSVVFTTEGGLSFEQLKNELDKALAE